MNLRNNKIHVVTVFFVLGFILTPMIVLANSAPVVSNVFAVQRDSSFIVDITYDLFDSDGDWMWVTLYFSPDGGVTWPVLCSSVTGEVGANISSGTGLMVEWNSRDDYPDLIATTCSIRVIANDEPPYPFISAFWKSDVGGANEIPFAAGDTLAFGQPFGLRWSGTAPSIVGMDPQMLAALDTVYPYDDGLLGYKYDLLDQNCIPTLDDCWSPKAFNEATGDSFSYFGLASSLDFHNDGSGGDTFHKFLPSGDFPIKLNTLDVAGLEIPEFWQSFNFVVNFDPETIMLDGETDWAHPEDPEAYPYYILLNDPTQAHHPFRSGDRIPDRTYVVVKALGRDDPRDLRLDENYKIGMSGFVRGTRQNYFGGAFSFQSESSVLNTDPPWGANPEGWYADTLGFLTGPNSEFTFNMQSVDEHGRRDGTPAAITFDVGYPPCIQCIEILPKSSIPSSYDETLPCLEDTSPASIAAHPCFGDTTILRVSNSGLGDGDLEFIQPAFMLVNKSTGYTQVVLNPGQGGEFNYEIEAKLYRMEILLHGLDNPYESWEQNERRMMGWAYQVDYECDLYNQIQDGGGIDDIRQPTWGQVPGTSGLEIDPSTGLWKISVDVAVPTYLMTQGQDVYRDIYLKFVIGIEDPDTRQMVFENTTMQFGQGRVQAIALDQTKCGFLPVRPAKYNFFRQVRPTVDELPVGVSWRDCDLQFIVPGILNSMDLSAGSMPSLNDEPAWKDFRLIVETATGDFECSAE